MILIPAYDEFNIYTSIDDVENYVEQLILEGYELKEEIYTLCLKLFVKDFQSIIDIIFEYEN